MPNNRPAIQKISKTPNQVAEQIERWFLMYHKSEKSSFNGSEAFTIFDHLYFEKQNEFIRRVQLNEKEIPVLILSINKNEFIINTTERFIHIDCFGTTSLFYKDFAGHNGFRAFGPGQMDNRAIVNIKTEGKLAEFGLKKKDGEVIYWSVPTGKPGFAFWNITNKFEIIGRRYVIKCEK
jgi:hypothetical protein